MALIYRLSPQGDLWSGLEFEEGEKTILDSQITNKDNEINNKNGEKEGSVSKRSIINELEDFL